MSHDTVTLRSGDLTLKLGPDCGGAVLSLRRATEAGPLDLLRPASADAIVAKRARDAACYPLVPFSNRIQDGLFRFEDAQYQLEPNMLPHPHPLHGHGWVGGWKSVHQQENSVELCFDYSGSDFPSAYRASQQFSLSSSRLSVRLAVTNTGSRRMPCGIGLHPFFPKPEGTELTIKTRQVWLGTDDCIPLVRVDVPARWDFSTGRPLGDVQLDHCFGGWDGYARIDWPSRGLRTHLRAEGPFEHTVIYVPAGQDFFCVEPVTNANNAFNLSARGVTGVGVTILAPGEELAGRVTLEWEPIPQH